MRKGIKGAVTALLFLLLAGNLQQTVAFYSITSSINTPIADRLYCSDPLETITCVNGRGICSLSLTSLQQTKAEKINENLFSATVAINEILEKDATQSAEVDSEIIPVVASAVFETPPEIIVQAQAEELPTPTAAPVTDTTSGLNADLIFDMVNAERAKAGLPAFAKDTAVCAIAAARGPELAGEVATGNLHAGLYNKNRGFYVTENMIYGNSEAFALNWWLNSPIHRSQIFGNFTYSCVVCVGNACAQIFTNYSPNQ